MATHCLQRFKESCILYLHTVHSNLSTTFFVVFACLQLLYVRTIAHAKWYGYGPSCGRRASFDPHNLTACDRNGAFPVPPTNPCPSCIELPCGGYTTIKSSTYTLGQQSGLRTCASCRPCPCSLRFTINIHGSKLGHHFTRTHRSVLSCKIKRSVRDLTSSMPGYALGDVDHFDVVGGGGLDGFWVLLDGVGNDSRTSVISEGGSQFLV